MAVPESNEVKFKALRDDLHRRYGHVVDSAEVDRVLDEIIDEHTSKANVQTFVPIIVERDAAEALEDRGFDEERSNRRRKILFVCEHNTGRSQVASVIARHHAEDRALICSVGPDPQPIGNTEIVNQLNERGYDTSLVYPKELTSRTIYESDYVVLIGGDELDGFRDNAAEEWHIDDPETMDADGVSKVIDDIDARVRNLLEQEGVLD